MRTRINRSVRYRCATTRRVSALAVVLASGQALAVINVPADQPTIAAAIAAAVPGEEIIVADGTYFETGLNPLGKDVNLHSANGAALCTIDGGGAGLIFEFNTGETSAMVVEGFTLTNGFGLDGGAMRIDSASPTVTDCVFTTNTSDFGGAVAIIGSSTSVFSGCSFTSNEGFTEAGAVDIVGNLLADVAFNNCTFTGNSSPAGGAMRIFDATVAFDTCVFDGNFTQFGSNFGGAIRSTNLTGIFDNCTFSNNTSPHEGGAWYFSAATLTVRDTVFDGNTCTGLNDGGSVGGAIRLRDGSTGTFERCDFLNNSITSTVTGRGAAVYNFTCDTDFTDCAFTNNTINTNDPAASTNGGAINIRGTSVNNFLRCTFTTNTIANADPAGAEFGGAVAIISSTASPSFNGCTFTGNSSEFAGGLYIQGFSTNRTFSTITFCTFTGNSSSFNGGALRILNNHEATLHTVNFNNNLSANDGGAVYIADTTASVASAAFTECLFIDNTAADEGGAMVVTVETHVTVTDCVFQSNLADGTLDGVSSGGAIRVRNNANVGPSVLTVDNCLFVDNSASGGFGGAIAAISSALGESNVDVSNLTIFGFNTASFGGAVHHQGFSDGIGIDTPANATYSNTTFDNNSSTSSGGALRALRLSIVDIDECLFTDNTAGNSGGGIYTQDSTTTVAHTRFDGNSSTLANGGAITQAQSGNLVVETATFIGNSALSGAGGAVAANGGNALVVNVSTSGNSALLGASFYALDTGAVGSSLVIHNSIVWDASLDDQLGADGALSTIEARWSDLRGGETADLTGGASATFGDGNICRDPHYVDSAGGDFRLAKGSPAVDAGDSNLSSGGLDLDGDPRITDSTAFVDAGPVTPAVDMGAFEADAGLSVSCIADLTSTVNPTSPLFGIADGIVDANDFFYFLDRFAAGELCAVDLTGSVNPTSPNFGKADDIIDANDFFYFIILWRDGCFP